ncbi:MAG TPA: TIM barrel protein [Clostridiaceae bacterium]
MDFSICIDALYNKKDFYEAMSEVKGLGYKAIEFWSWWDKDLEKLVKTKDELGLEIATFCTKMISLTEEENRTKYIEGLKESIAVCKSLGCKSLISQVGNEVLKLSREEQIESIIKGLKEAAPYLENSDITLVVEPLNTKVDHKGYFLSSSEEAFHIIKEVGSPKVKVLYDIYHQQITEGNIISTILENIDNIGHFHSAGNPGRHELYTGELNYSNIIREIRKTSYKGYFGLEYFPIEEAKKGLLKLLKEDN